VESDLFRDSFNLFTSLSEQLAERRVTNIKESEIMNL
jgi:hypothetical protein